MYTIDKKVASIRTKISDYIINWSLSNEKFLNIISPPYNLSEFFLEIIIKFVRQNKKVLYITNEITNNAKIISCIRRYTTFREYDYYAKKEDFNNNYLLLASHSNASNIQKKFDLVIYDDIKSFSLNKKEDINILTMKLCKNSGKIITYSIEKIFDNERTIECPIRKNGIPLVEPKFIGTRIDINKDIPYVIYEYIKWSISNSYKVIIYVPDKRKVSSVYNYLCKYCGEFNSKDQYFFKNNNENKTLCSFKEIKNRIIITNDFNDSYLKSKNINVMVFFADNVVFNYKRLVYLCGKVGINENRHNGEVVFLATRETEDIDKSRYITRYFNKKAWEMNLLKI